MSGPTDPTASWTGVTGLPAILAEGLSQTSSRLADIKSRMLSPKSVTATQDSLFNRYYELPTREEASSTGRLLKKLQPRLPANSSSGEGERETSSRWLPRIKYRR